MNSKTLFQAILCAALFSLVSGCGDKSQPAPATRSAEDILGGMRLKQLTKDLALTEEQQGKLKALLDEEGKEIVKVRAQAELSITEQAIKVGELKKETFAKLKPLLTPAQLEKLEQQASKPKRK